MDTVDNAITKPVHRLEVFTGAGRRRSFSDEDKARIVAEIVTSGDSVSGVARRYGLSPQQLFGWRRQVRKAQPALSEAEGLRFVPAVMDGPSSALPVRRQCKAPQCEVEPGAGTIAVEIDGVTVRSGDRLTVDPLNLSRTLPTLRRSGHCLELGTDHAGDGPVCPVEGYDSIHRAAA